MSDNLLKFLRYGDHFERVTSSERAADLIEELEAENADLKDKLTKALEALRYYAQDDDDGGWLANTTLAELAGGKDE